MKRATNVHEGNIARCERTIEQLKAQIAYRKYLLRGERESLAKLKAVR